ncbi:MAG: cache domain-containing protein [Leucothrix sp.]
MPLCKQLAISVGLLLPLVTTSATELRPFAESKISTKTFKVSFADTLTPEDAKLMSTRAAALINEKGTLGIADFSRLEAGFLMKDGYVFCMSMRGVMISHPIRNQLIGQNLYDYKRFGQPFFREMVDVAQRDGEGWVEYKWPYPGTSELRLKMSYVVKNEAGFFCGVSAFK